jgi:hypothetical protein
VYVDRSPSTEGAEHCDGEEALTTRPRYQEDPSRRISPQQRDLIDGKGSACADGGDWGDLWSDYCAMS